MENFTLHAVEKQYSNDTVLKMIAEYICSNSRMTSPMADLHCREFPVKHAL